MKRLLILFGFGLLLAIPLAFLWRNDPRDVIYVPSPPEVIDAMLELAAIRSDDVVYDLGCGDGRILIAASRRFGVKSWGFDIDPERVREAKDNAAVAGVVPLVTIEERNLFDVDLAPATVVMMYLSPKINLRLVPQFAKMPPGSRIVSHDFEMPGYRPKQTLQVKVPGKREHHIYLWMTPLASPPDE